MILSRGEDAQKARDEGAAASIDGEDPRVERAVFCSLWSTGPDTTLDGVFRLQALRSEREGSSDKRFDELCNPFADEPHRWPSDERLEREFGLARAALEAAPPITDVWPAFRSFIAGGPVIAPEIESFETWHAHLCGARGGEPLGIGLTEIAALLFPGRLALRREDLVLALITRDASAPVRALAPEELRTALFELVRRFHAQVDDVLRVAGSGYERAWKGLCASAPLASRRLRLALDLVDRSGAWCGADARKSAPLPTKRLAEYAAHEIPLEDILEALRPRCAREAERWRSAETIPPDKEEPVPFDEADLEIVDDVFEQHLPAGFARGSQDHASSLYRSGQHDVARKVAAALGSHELLLMHAPTGTGKTLAYLIPAMLWSRRHGVRIGIATYTRALQEQAMDREVPRALSALARAGVAAGTRVSLLKGRENYLCWRALKNSIPTDEEDGETWLAWTSLAQFALSDIDGDLDRLPLRPALPLESSAPYLKILGALVRHVRAQVACCSQRDDRETCAAEVARRRAERSHVVIVNQAFVLARQEFFKHLVFDECEHLHDQAHSAWSHTLSLRDVRGLLSRLRHRRRAGSRAVLDRLESMLLEGTPSYKTLHKVLDACKAFASALDRLESAIAAFESWREQQSRLREERDNHSLLREYVTENETGELVQSRVGVAHDGNELGIALAELEARLSNMPLRGIGSIRRSLDLARTDLSEMLAGIEAWIPLDEMKPAFRPRTFYDVERDPRGDLVLAARVLLPNEFLGRNYYPQLSTGIFMSATTWLQESFEPAMAYLGLDRAAQPAPDEERPPCVVHTFRAPEVFDYSRVLVAVPRDAPTLQGGKDAFLDYVRRFVAHLGERTRGRMLVLFTNSQDVKRVGQELSGFFHARRIALWFQNMEGSAKEELGEMFRSRVDSVLLGVDTFWYGADFPGETLEYLVIVKLPYGVPDRYHHAQCAVLGVGEQQRKIYRPRALAKFRQGFGRLMRRASDRGCVFILDGRVLDPRHRFFLKELPISRSFDASMFDEAPSSTARFVRGDTDTCVRAAMEHMSLVEDVRNRGLEWGFAASTPGRDEHAPVEDSAPSDDHSPRAPLIDTDAVLRRLRPPQRPMDIPAEDLPY